MSKSESNSPNVIQKHIVPPLSSRSVANSPRISRSNRYVQKMLENDGKKILLDGQGAVSKQSIIIGKASAIHYNGSSDSSEGKKTPPKLHVITNPVTKTYSWKGNNLKVPYGAPSLRSLKTNTADDKSAASTTLLPPSSSLRSFTYSDVPIRPLSDVTSVRSLMSIGMGSTDGKKLTIRRVPNSLTDLLNIVHPSPATAAEEDLYSSCGTLSDGSLSDITTNYRGYRKDHWSNKIQFVMACVGYSVGLGNIWRFPYMCYKSGGGVFLIPYFLIQLMCGIPLLYMELAIGQLTRRGPIGALSKICPIFKGAGISSVVISFFLSTYYNVIIAYGLFYLFSALHNEPPWGHCHNRWNTVNCWTASMLASNKTKPIFSVSPAEEFYNKKVLQITTSIEEIGEMRWELVACLFIVWILTYFTLWKSIRSSGRVLYFTASVPFLLVFMFLGHSLSLQGAQVGLQYLFKPNWQLLLDSKVWVNAAAQNFNSIGIGFGSIISFASYNRYENGLMLNTIAVSSINAIASVLVAIFTFATLGNIAWQQNKPIRDVITDGPGLAFVLYPEALTNIPFSTFWAILFFFTLFCLSLNSEFAIVEVIVTSIQDGFPNWTKRKLDCHEILVLVVCLISFSASLPYVTQGGAYLLQLIDYYIASVSIICVAFFEVIAVMWFYGAKRFSKNIEKMTGSAPCFFFLYCWTIASPFLIMCVWIFSLLDYEPPTLNNGRYHFPMWAETLGWICVILCLISIPTVAIYVLLRAEGQTLYQKFRNSLKPRIEDYGKDELEYDQSKELNTLIECKILENNGITLTSEHPETV